MRDADLRRGLTNTIRDKMAHTPHILVPEVEIRWSVPGRADALLVADRIAGFEIKSDVDNLSRLPRQVQAYGQVVEHAHLVATRKHLQKATATVPPWWHIWVAQQSANDTSIVRRVRRGRLNPDINPVAVTTFLTREQLTAALASIGERRLSTRSADDLRILLTGRLGKAATLRLARTHMLTRADWRIRSLTAH